MRCCKRTQVLKRGKGKSHGEKEKENNGLMCMKKQKELDPLFLDWEVTQEKGLLLGKRRKGYLRGGKKI